MSGPSLTAVLFTDLVGSTAQRSDLGEEVGDELRRTHDRLLTEAVEAHGGRVIKSTGDGIMATFPGAAEAVAGAVAIQQAVDRHNRRADALAPLSVRTGISAGDVIWEDDDAFGTPAIEAARLCARAEGGQILAADVVRVLAGAREGDRFCPVGDLELKGLPGLMTAWEIGWQPDTEPIIPVPGGLAPVGGFSFVGRTPELDALDDAWRAVVDGQRRAVFVAGEPGIGKTRLVSQFAHRVAGQGGVVLYGRAEPELGVPYKPVVEALAGYVRDCPQTELAAQVGSLSRDLTRLVPQLAARVPDLAEPLRAEPETQRYRLFEAVVELLGNASRSWPVVLILDDLQWAGKPTILLLGHLVASDPGMRVLVVGGYRDTEVGPDHPLTGLLAEIHRVGGIESLSLEGLGEPEVAELTSDATGIDPSGLAQQVLGATDGNPFFVSEILRAVTATGQRGEVDLASLGVPEGVQAMVTARLNQLHHDRRPVLETAAVVGQRFDLPLLCAAGVDDDLTLAAVAEAEAAGLIGTQELLGGRQFAHALIRDALYHSLTPTARVARHRQVLAALETLPDADRRLSELVHHATQAIDLLGVDSAVDYARRAGDRARHDLAFEEAASHYQHGIGLLDQTDQTSTGRFGDLQIALTEALCRSGMNEAGTEALLAATATARHLGDGDRLARALLAGRVGGYSQLWFASTAHVDLYREALAELGDEDSHARAVLLADLGERLWYLGSYEEAEQLGFEALAVARRLSNDDTLREVLSQTYDFLQRVDNLEDRITRWGDELIETSYRAGDLEKANRGLMHRAGCYMEICELDRAEADLREAERLLDSIGQPWFAFYVAAGRTCLALIRGQLDEAERSIGEMMSYAEAIPERWFKPIVGTAVGCLLWQQGRTGDLRAAAQALMDEQPEMAGRIQVMAALIYAENGEASAADELLDEFVETDFAIVPPDGPWLTSMTALAYAAVRTGHREAAASIESVIEPYADRIATQGEYTMGPVATALGSLATTRGHYEEAERRFRSAADLCERGDLRSFLALTRLHWAQMLTLLGRPDDRARAATLARHALAAAEETGMGGVAREARQLLEEIDS